MTSSSSSQRKQSRARAILVVDPDEEFLDSLRADPRAEIAPLELSTTGRDAQLCLADPNRRFLGIFVNPEVPTPGGEPGGISVIRAAHQHRPAVPIHVIHDGPNPFSARELQNLGVRSAIAKPVGYSRLLEVANPESVFSARDAIGVARQEAAAELSGPPESDAEFVAISAGDFLAGSRSFFDIHVRISSGRYLKLLKAGDAFQPERIASYLEKGIENFHIRREAQQQYLNYCSQLTERIVSGNGISMKLKSSQTADHGEQVLSFLKTQGFSEANLKYAQDFAGNLARLAHRLKGARSDILNAFLADFTSYQHGVAVSMIAGLIARQMKIESDEAHRIVGMAALMHDIGLFPMPDEVQHEDRSRMTNEQKALYETHAVTGALILRAVRGVHPTVIQAVGQHHERRDRHGFPARIGSGRINRVAEIVGVSDELVRLIVELPLAAPGETQSGARADKIRAQVSEALRAFRLR